MKKLLVVFAVLLVMFSLAACQGLAQPTQAPVPTVVLGDGASPDSPAAGEVRASGNIVPAQQTRMVFTLGQKVKSVNVAEGERVEAGQELVVLQGREALEAAVSAAQFELAQAEQAILDLTSQAEDARIQAMQSIITYERAVRDAQYALDNFTIPSNQQGLGAVEALQAMKQKLDAARTAFEPYKHFSADNGTRADLRDDMNRAQADYNTAVRRLQYEYDVEVANANLAQAQADYSMYAAGPDPAQLKLAEARRDTAQAQLAAAQAALDNLTLTAPFAATASEVNIHPGEWVTAGQPVVVLTDLDHLRVETVDLSEGDVPQVQLGQKVSVSIDALDQDVPGTVAAIAPIAGNLGGDVVYKVTIDLDSLPDGLRAGMSVEVTFGQ